MQLSPTAGTLTLIILGFCVKSNQNVIHSFDYGRGFNETEGGGFLGDAAAGGSRFGRGGGASGSGTSTAWTFTSNAARSRIVETKYGRVQGLSVTMFSNMHFSGNRNFQLKNKITEIFFGIPYAAPPVKSHRFSPTQTPVPWNDVKATIQPSPVCPQIFPDIRNESAALKEMPKGYLEYLRRIEPYLRNQSEDCLYLNIFAPIGPDTKPKPVTVFFHGGSFAWGSGNLIDGSVMAAYADVLLVTFNYRLGILGFLNLNDSPGSKPRVANYGLMDQIAALHWIKENIRAFGGDSENITLMGYEAGAACINFLMSSPTVANGLFHRSLLIAGSAQAPWALISDPSVAGLNVAQALNCSENSTTGLGGTQTFPESGATATTTPSPSHLDPILECLKTKHFTEFTKFSLPKFSLDFGPSVDGIVVKPNYRANSPSQMGKREVTKKYDVLVGLSALERLTEFSQMDLEFGFESPRRDAILRTLVRNSYRYHRNEILATITNEYIDWEKTAQHPTSTRDMAVNAVTDCLSLAPLVAATDSSAVRKSYFYVFEHSTKDGLYNYHRNGPGAGGGEELTYMFGFPLVEYATGQVLPFIPAPLPSNFSKGEVALSELWMSFISNFAHSGSPNGPIKIDSISQWPVSKERNRYKSTAWDGYDRLHQKYLEIGANKIRTRSHYRAHQMAIWLRLVPELQRSGAQMASTFHNRMKGGNDPVLYAGRLKHPEDEGEELPPDNPAMNSAMLYDLLVGYGYIPPNSDPLDPDLDLHLEGSSNSNRTGASKLSPTLTMTTCYSPVSSSVQSGNGRLSPAPNETSSSSSSPNFFDSSHFPPYSYSLVLAVTIGVGCSLLILNISILALVYIKRGRRRSKLRKSTSSVTGVVSTSSPGGGSLNRATTCTNSDTDDDLHAKLATFSQEPPELLLSNRSTATSFLPKNSQSHIQAEIEALEVLELTVKQHQQELLGEKALRSMEFPHSHSTHTLPKQPYHASPMSVSSSQRSSSTQQSQCQGQGQQGMISISTLPRCNGSVQTGLGMPSFLGGGGKGPQPQGPQGQPSRAQAQGQGQGMGTLRRSQRVEYSDTCSDSNNEHDELKV